MITVENGSVAFAGEAYKDVTFKRAFRDGKNKFITVTGTGNVNHWISNLTGVGFRINMGAAFTGTLYWKLDRDL